MVTIGEKGDGDSGCLIILFILFVVFVYFAYQYSVPPIPTQEAINIYKAGQKYLLTITPSGGDPVKVGSYRDWSACEEIRRGYIRRSLNANQPIPTLKCVPTLPWWRVFIK